MADEVPSEYSTYYKKTTKRPKGILFILSLLVFVLIGIFVVFRFFSIDSLIASITKSDVSPTPTNVPQEPTPTTEPSLEPESDEEEADEDVTPTPTGKKGTPTPTTKPGGVKVDRSSLTVAVQNGSGEAGAARKVANALSGLGYKLGTVGNADAFDYTGITIQVKSTKGNYLDQLKKDLSEDYVISSATKDLPSSFAADALVIYGQDE